jgi:hypothetical protein
MYWAFPSPDYYADSTTPRTHQQTSRLAGRHQRPGAHGALPTFTMIRLTGSVAGFTPADHPAGTRSLPPATAQPHGRAKRAATTEGGIVAASSPCPPGLGPVYQ